MFASLFTEKAPYIITLLIAGLGWTLQRTVTVLTESPTISYHFVSDNYDKPAKGMREVICTVANISRTRQFRGLQFKFVGLAVRENQKKASFMAPPWIIPVAPAMDMESAEVATNGSEATFPIPLLQPGWRIELHAIENSTDAPVALVQASSADDSPDSLGADASKKPVPDTVRLLPSGFSTWLVDNELSTLYGFSIVWLVGIGSSLWVASRNVKTPDPKPAA